MQAPAWQGFGGFSMTRRRDKTIQADLAAQVLCFPLQDSTDLLCNSAFSGLQCCSILSYSTRQSHRTALQGPQPCEVEHTKWCLLLFCSIAHGSSSQALRAHAV